MPKVRFIETHPEFVKKAKQKDNLLGLYLEFIEYEFDDITLEALSIPVVQDELLRVLTIPEDSQKKNEIRTQILNLKIDEATLQKLKTNETQKKLAEGKLSIDTGTGFQNGEMKLVSPEESETKLKMPPKPNPNRKSSASLQTIQTLNISKPPEKITPTVTETPAPAPVNEKPPTIRNDAEEDPYSRSLEELLPGARRKRAATTGAKNRHRLMNSPQVTLVTQSEIQGRGYATPTVSSRQKQNLTRR